MKEISCGIIIFAEGKERKYLLLHYPGGHWDFAKGHVERGEGRHETALREAKEETGIGDIVIIDGFQEKMEYKYMREGILRHKEVFFFLGKTGSVDVRLSDEHTGYAWLPFTEAKARLTFRNAKDLIQKAEFFLKNEKKNSP